MGTFIEALALPHGRRRLTVAVALALTAAAAQAQETGAPATAELDRIVVTATKRAESVREVAGSVSAVTAQQLDEIGAQSLADYIQRTPGVVFNSYQPGVSHVVIRGIATSAGNVQGQPTTGYYLNEIPLTEPGWTIAIPDIDTFDLSRVEVLRGPQGSLFGSASMGGAVNYVANLADTSGFDAAVEAELAKTRNADPATTLKAMVNLPLKPDVFAIRAVAAHRDDPGWIDNVGTGVRGANDTTTDGGRLSLVLTPNENTTLSWLSLLQKIDSDDNAYRIPALGDLVRSTAISEPTDTEVKIHSLRLDQDVGWGSLTALAARQEKSQDWRFDYTPIRGAYNADLDLDLTSPLYIASGGDSTSDSLELRLASNDGGRFEWLLGTMFYDTDKDLYETIGADGAAAAFDGSSLFGAGSGAVIAPDGKTFNAFYTRVQGKEKALFGEASVRFSPQWKLTAGGRLFRTEVENTTTQVGFSTYPGAPIVTYAKTKESGFTPKLSLSWTPNDRVMAYALASEGFRFGTPNTPGLSAYPVPSGSGSDKLRNYELGLRSSWLDNRLLLDATAFYIDWSDIQLRLQTPDFFNYAANGGKASSKGVEFSAQWRPNAHFDLSHTTTWQRARLDEDLFILWYGTAPKGARLPGTADWSSSTTASYRFDGWMQPTLIFAHRYLSEGISDLNSAVPGVTPNEQGDYNLFDLRLRLSFGSTDVTLFGSNLTDERGVTRTVAEVNGVGEGLVRPRSFGVNVHWRY
ncbi:MAG: TonB-dependent receptor [Pseudoxanthomonas sp.]